MRNRSIPLRGSPVVSVVNSSPRITINAADPLIILSTEIVLVKAAKLAISGVICGTFYYVCGIAAYVNGTPVSLGTGNNQCHPDCFQISHGLGHNSRMLTQPYQTISPELEAGHHQIEVGVISRWGSTSQTMYVNNRQQGDMASSSSLKVEAF